MLFPLAFAEGWGPTDVLFGASLTAFVAVFGGGLPLIVAELLDRRATSEASQKIAKGLRWTGRIVVGGIAMLHVAFWVVAER